MNWLWLVALGFGAGSYGVMVGAGGGFIIAPVLLTFFEYEPNIAAGTSLALVAVNGLSGSMVYLRSGLVDRRSAILFAAAALPGSVLAPFALKRVPGEGFMLAFGLLLVGLAIQSILRRDKSETASSSPASKGSGPFWLNRRERHFTAKSGEKFRYSFSETPAMIVNFALGFVSSFFGVGAGFLRTPLLISYFGFPAKVAAVTSVCALTVYSTAGTVAHASLDHVEWYPAFVGVGAGMLVGGQLGAHVGTRLRGHWIVRLLVLLLAVLGIRLIVEALL